LELRLRLLLVDLLFFAAKVAADYADCDEFGQAKFTFWVALAVCAQTKRSRAAHVAAGARVDLDRLAFLDEKRDVDGLASFEFRRLGNVARRVPA
jgi:hypothetical protein